LKSVLIDSDILIEVSRAKATAILAKWDDLSRGNTALLCSPVTVAELWHGARQTEQKILDALFATIQCVPIDLEIGRQAGEYLRQYGQEPQRRTERCADSGDSCGSWFGIVDP
jgi:predicted nucleic acid-binding protein